MLPSIRTIESPERYDAQLNDDVKIAVFTSPADESAYEARDSFLIHLIARLVAEHFGPDAQSLPHQNEDWWPNHTHYLEMTPGQCTLPFLEGLQRLLADEFADYRILIRVYDDFFDGTSEVGSMVLYADRVVIETRLNARLKLD
jgi:hypothetical protein